MQQYTHWLGRFKQVLSAYRHGLISEAQLESFQLFLLETGQFNASFTTDELNRLEYPKSPFTVMNDNAYLRVTNTWAMQIISMEYQTQNICGDLALIGVDSEYFWNELYRYNRVIKVSDFNNLEQKLLGVIQELQTNKGKLINVWWIELDKSNISGNIEEAFKNTKDIIARKLQEQYQSRETLKLSKLGCFFRDKFDGIGNFQAMDMMVATKHFYPIVNNLGYRIDPVRAMRNVLKIYPGLFVEHESTNKFWQAFKKTINYKKLAVNEQNVIGDLQETVTNSLLNLQTTTLPAIDNQLDITNQDLPLSFDIYRKYIAQYLMHYKRNSVNSVIRYVTNAEMQQNLIGFEEACAIQSLSQAVRVTQKIAEIMQLNLMLTPPLPEQSFAAVMHSNYLQNYCQFVQAVSLTPYAMRSFARVLQILPTQLNNKIAITNQSYYEVLENFSRINGSTNTVDLIKHITDIREDVDVIFIEMHPNNVLESKQYAHDALLLLDFINNWNNKPRTLVLDITLNALNDREVYDILDKATGLIESGYLNVVLIQSLTKFAQLGLDKRSAGSITLLNKNCNIWQEVNNKFREISNVEKVDHSTDSFFTYFANHHKDLLKQYIEQINRNVRYVYKNVLENMNSLETLARNRFQITMSSDPKACYVAINMNGLLPEIECDHNTSKAFSISREHIEQFSQDLLDNMIYPLCQFHNLPITARQSIGFPLSSVTAVNGSLRLTIGLESEEQLNGYAEILSYTAFVLNRHRDPELFFYPLIGPLNKGQKVQYQLLNEFFAEKVVLYKAMTPGQSSRYSLNFNTMKNHIELTFNNGQMSARSGSISQSLDQLLQVSDIITYIRGRNNAVLVSTLTPSQQRVVAGCFTSLSCPGKDVEQNVKIKIRGRVLSLPSFEMLGTWNAPHHYGPFILNGHELTFRLHQKQINCSWNNQTYSEANMLVRQGRINVPLIDIPIEDRAFLFREGAYQYQGDRNSWFYTQPTTVNCRPLDYRLMRLNIENEKLVIEHDFLFYHNLHGASIYNRNLGEQLTCYEVDYWGEKDPILARFLRLVTAAYVKEAQPGIAFNARDARFIHFLFNLNQGTGDALFLEAVNKVLLCKNLLAEHFIAYQKNYHTTALQQYCFGNHPPSWPSGFSGPNITQISDGIISRTTSLLREYQTPPNMEHYH